MKRFVVFLFLLWPVWVSIARAATIPTVHVGNAGNQGFGAVDHNFRIGVTEVTNQQYVGFLNAVAGSDPFELFNPLMGTDTRGGIVRIGAAGNYSYTVKSAAIGQGPGGADYAYGNKPVVFVSWYDCVRFANWVNNGEGSGSTETGAYTLLGGSPVPSNGNSITRNAGAGWFLPTREEWLKAAYHMNDGVTANYFGYPTKAATPPDNNLPSGDSGNSANWNRTGPSETYPLTDVGAYMQSESAYGTFDQAGNVFEWNETLLAQTFRSDRGGAWSTVSDNRFHYTYDDFTDPAVENTGLGFRMATRIVDFDDANSSDPAYLDGARAGNGGAPAPPVTITLVSLDLLDGSSFVLDPHETLTLTGGPLMIRQGAVFTGNGIIQGNVINAGLLRIPIVRVPTIMQTSGGHIQLELPAPPGPSLPIIISSTGFGVQSNTILSFGGSADGPSPPPIVIDGTPAANEGVISWDASLEITGSFEQRETGALRLFIGGDDMPGVNYSQLTVGEEVMLAGALELVLQPELFEEFGYVPKVGDTFDLIKATEGISIADSGLTLRAYSTEDGAPLITNLTFNPYNSSIAADPDRLFQIGEMIFSWELVENSTILRATLVHAVAVVPEPTWGLSFVLGTMGSMVVFISRRGGSVRSRGRVRA